MSILTKPKMTSEAYFADLSAISFSMLETFIQSPRLYWMRYITRTSTQKITNALRFGTLAHYAVFEPEIYKTLPFASSATMQSKEWDQLTLKHPHLTVGVQNDIPILKGIQAGIAANPLAAKLISDKGICEEPIFWIDEETGLPLKCKPDKVIPRKRICTDLKTTDDPSPAAFAKTIVNWKYARRAAYYLPGLKSKYGFDFNWIFIAAGKDEPHDAVLHDLSEEDLEAARKQNRRDLAELKDRIDNDDWSGRYKGVNRVTLPRWAKEEIV